MPLNARAGQVEKVVQDHPGGILMTTINEFKRINAYRYYLITTGRETAAENYPILIHGFAQWLKDNTEHNLETFTYQEAEVYMWKGFKSPRTANNFKIALTGYLRFGITSIQPSDPTYQGLTQKLDQMRYLKNRKVVRKYEKMSLEVEEVREFLKTIKGIFREDSHIYSLGVMLAYFGTRPIEIEKNVATAKVNWKDHSMIIESAKTKQPRYLCWPEALDEHMVVIRDNAPFPYAGENFTKAIGYKQGRSPDAWLFPGDMKITAKTFRKTFQTQERLLGVSDLFIDAVMGHENKMSKMGNIYTDYTSPEFIRQIREVMLTDKHYFIKYGVV